MYSTVYNVTSSLTSVDVDVSYDGPFPVKYVVTNDLMRDHRVAFLEPRPFMRWRNTQIVYFGLSKAAVATDYLQLLNSTSDGLIGSNSSTTVNATDSDNSVSTSSSLSEPNAVLDAHSDGVVIQGISQEDLDGECTNSTAPEYRPPVVYLYEPGKR